MLGFAQVKSIPQIHISSTNTLHILSPENIQYVDISSAALAGDLPLKNLLRLKLLPDSLKYVNWTDGFVVTIVGETFMAQYRICYSLDGLEEVPLHKSILPDEMVPLEVPGISLSSVELRKIAFDLLKRNKGKAVTTGKGFDLRARVNRIGCLDDYIFLDLSFQNTSQLPFNIDQVRFKVEDRKVNKATNVQSLEISPEFILHSNTSFRKHYRNIYVFRKFTFPGNKRLTISLTEKQLSAREIVLELSYRDLLRADAISFN